MQEERDSFSSHFISGGMVDTFRHQHPGVVAYTYVSHRCAWGAGAASGTSTRGWLPIPTSHTGVRGGQGQLLAPAPGGGGLYLLLTQVCVGGRGSFRHQHPGVVAYTYFSHSTQVCVGGRGGDMD